MGMLFLSLLNRSIAASWLILAAAALRLALKKAPKWMSCALWALVAVRLICPFSLESAASLLPSAQTLPPEAVTGPSFHIDSGIAPVDDGINNYLDDHYYEGVSRDAGLGQRRADTLGLLWLAGLGLMGIYAAASLLRLKKRVAASLRQPDGVWLCDDIETPSILGALCPRIYLPSGMDGAQAAHVLAHERAHIARRDHLWKPLGFLLLSVYWFNPLCWLAYLLLCRDIELACDERVIRALGKEERLAYSEALLACSAPQRGIAACPLAFGEVGVKERIKTVLNYRKPAFWLIAAAAVLCITAAVCFLTDPPADLPAQGPAQGEEKPAALRLDDVLRLAEKGEALGWSDLDGFAYTETGSGLYIRLYAIDELFSLRVGGSGTGQPPLYMNLQVDAIATQTDHNYVDIRTGDAAAFITAHRGDLPAGAEFLSFSMPIPAEDCAITRGYTEEHRGIDLAAAEGEPVYAAAAGTVVFAGVPDEWNAQYGAGYGLLVVVDHGGGLETLYAHCSELLVSAGDAVARGQQLAKVGSTGNSTGNHLHFELRRTANRSRSPLSMSRAGCGSPRTPMRAAACSQPMQRKPRRSRR